MSKRSETTPTLPDVLEELELRFLTNLPETELNDAVRVFMQIEQAHWFYEDFFVDNHAHLKSMKMKDFAQALFKQSVVLSPISEKCEAFFNRFKNYRHQIPVCGAIILNERCDKMLLVRSWQGKSWTFPRGKINEGEEEAFCAAREVYEETGFQPVIDPQQHVRLEANDHGKQVILYVVPGVQEIQHFEPKARKEVSKVEWFPLSTLPKGHYNVAPFMGRLKKIAAGLRKQQGKSGKNSHTLKVSEAVSKKHCNSLSPNSRSMHECDQKQPKKLQLDKPDAKKNGKSKQRNSQRAQARGCFGTEDTYDFDVNNSDTFERCLGGGVKGGSKGWGIEAMFEANSKLTGLQYTYDGNPHSFGDQHEKAVRVGQDTQKSLWRAEGNEHVTGTVVSSSNHGTSGLTPTVAALFASATHMLSPPPPEFPAPPVLNPSVAALFASAAEAVSTPPLDPTVAALFATAPQPAVVATVAPQSCAAAVSSVSGCGWKGGLLMPMSS